MLSRMALDMRETRGYEPVGTLLPSFLPPLQHDFFTAMVQGKRLIPTARQIDAAVRTHFAYEPLVPLTSEQEKHLREDMREQYKHIIASNEWEGLTGDVFLDMQAGKPILLMGEKGQESARNGHLPISAGEKERLITDPDFYVNGRYSDGHITSSLCGWGTRHLCDEQGTMFKLSNGTEDYDTYGYKIADFLAMLSQVRRTQGKTDQDKLNGLDIGGSNGLGAHDAEDLDQNLDVTNITADPALGVWPLRGGHRILQAERLPKEFSEQFDIVFSHLAFRYMRYRGLALENVIRALRKGGILSIHFSSDHLLMPGETVEQREGEIDSQFQRMEDLQTQGIIKYIPMTGNFYDARGDWLRRRPEGDIHGMICLQKTGNGLL